MGETTRPITVRTLTAREFQVLLPGEQVSVAALKKCILEREEIAEEQVLLFSKGQIVDDALLLAAAEAQLPVYLFWVEPGNIVLGTQKLLDSAKDWETRNKMKAYLGVYALSNGAFSEAAQRLTDVLSVFSSEDFFPYALIVRYALLAGCVSHSRKELKELAKKSEVLEAAKENADMVSLTNSLCTGEYKLFFPMLLRLGEALQADSLLQPHTTKILRRIRIRLYEQILSVYSTVALSSLSEKLGLSPSFIEQDLVSLISSSALHCAIDLREGYVERKQAQAEEKKHVVFSEESRHLTASLERLARSVGAQLD